MRPVGSYEPPPRCYGRLIFAKLAVELKSVGTGPGYECRNRNRAEDGKISAHASGLAIDVGGFVLSNGRTLAIAPNEDEHAGHGRCKPRCCMRLVTTVFGPGSDAPFIGLKAWRGAGKVRHLKPISLPNVSCCGVYQFERGNDGTCDGNAQEIFDFNPRLCLHGPRKTACDRAKGR